MTVFSRIWTALNARRCARCDSVVAEETPLYAWPDASPGGICSACLDVELALEEGRAPADAAHATDFDHGAAARQKGR